MIKVKFTTSIRGLERHFDSLQTEVQAGLGRLMVRQQARAEELAKQIIDAQIYNTPERGGYKRTGALKNSIYAVLVTKANGLWDLIIGAVGGAGGLMYALYNERGTYGGRVTLDEITRRAMAESYQQLLVLEYGSPDKGLEPRPWTIPTAVSILRELPPLVQQVIQDAEYVARRAV